MDLKTKVWDLAPGDGLTFAGAVSQVRIVLLHKSGRRARLVVEAPDGTRIIRQQKDSGQDTNRA